jgi:hypothetical protein
MGLSVGAASLAGRTNKVRYRTIRQIANRFPASTVTITDPLPVGGTKDGFAGVRRLIRGISVSKIHDVLVVSTPFCRLDPRAQPKFRCPGRPNGRSFARHDRAFGDPSV